MTRTPISVLVVDDSPVVRQVLSQLLTADPFIGEVDTAPSAGVALRKIRKRDPDVVTMDVEMPGTDGLAALEEIMATAPRPVIMVSAVTHEGAEKTLRALSIGAVDFIPKPGGPRSRDIAQIATELREKIRAVAPSKAKLARRRPRPGPGAEPKPPPAPRPAVKRVCRGRPLPHVVAVGASTGGTDAILQVLLRLPADFPVGVLVVQHMPEGFTRSFARRLDELCPLEVKEAANHDLVQPGRVLLAPGHSHMVLQRDDDMLFVELSRAPEVNGHRPSVDVLFDSVADVCQNRSVAVLLTGMGRDGASGMRRIHDAGALTMAQDQESCVVFGMPKVAIQEGSVDLVANQQGLGDAVALVGRGAPPPRPSPLISPERTTPKTPA